MSALPPFKLRNLPQALPNDHVRASESTPGDRPRSSGAVPPQSSPGHLARCPAWAQASGHCLHSSQLAARFDGRQVSAELFEQFRASPEFGRSLSERVYQWMKACGWEPWSPPTDQATVAQHTWRRDDFVATDVVTRNAIVSEADGRLRDIDFVVTHLIA